MPVKSIRTLLTGEGNTQNAYLLCEMTHERGQHSAVWPLVAFISKAGKCFAI
jgi:hypothetical protein